MLELTGIKNIIFDLGNVLLDVEPAATTKAFEKLGISSLETTYKLATQEGLFIDFELGLITEHEFREKLRKFSRTKISNEEIDLAWNAMLMEISQSRLNLLLELVNHFNLYLLSNTNQIHYNWFSKQYNGLFDAEKSTLFKKTYYSHLLKLRKPNPEIYHHVINDADILPHESLFIDDLEVNILAAKEIGFKVELKARETDIVELF